MWYTGQGNKTINFGFSPKSLFGMERNRTHVKARRVFFLWDFLTRWTVVISDIVFIAASKSAVTWRRQVRVASVVARRRRPSDVIYKQSAVCLWTTHANSRHRWLHPGNLLSRRSRQRERLSATMLSICLFVSLSGSLSVCRQNATKRDFLKSLAI